MSCHLPRSEPRLPCRWPICRCLCLCLCPLVQLAPLAVCCQDKRHNFYAVLLPFPTGTKRQVSHVADVGVWPMGDALLLLLHVAAAQIVCAASEKFAGNKVIYLILVYFILLPLPVCIIFWPFGCWNWQQLPGSWCPIGSISLPLATLLYIPFEFMLNCQLKNACYPFRLGTRCDV